MGLLAVIQKAAEANDLKFEQVTLPQTEEYSLAVALGQRAEGTPNTVVATEFKNRVYFAYPTEAIMFEYALDQHDFGPEQRSMVSMVAFFTKNDITVQRTTVKPATYQNRRLV